MGQGRPDYTMTTMPKLSLAGKAFPVEDTEQKPGKLPTVHSGVLARIELFATTAIEDNPSAFVRHTCIHV